jgi:uncharacterized membrane protein
VDVLATEALQLTAGCLGRLGRLEESLGVWEQVISGGEDCGDLEIRTRVAQAFSNRAVGLDRLGRPVQAIVSIDELVRRVGEQCDPRIRTFVSAGLSIKARIMARVSRPAEADAACVGNSPQAALRSAVVTALMLQAALLSPPRMNDHGVVTRVLAAHTDPQRDEVVDRLVRPIP